MGQEQLDDRPQTLVLYRTRPAGLPDQRATDYGARPIQLFEGSRPVRRHLCKFNGVSVMRKTRGIGGGADQSTGRSAAIVVCVQKFQARSLVGDNESAPRLQVMGSTERARSEWEFHSAAPMRKGGERSWSWAAVSLSMTTMGPPHWGQNQSGFDCLASGKAAGERSAGGWRGSRSGGCGRSLWAAGATESGAGTHRALGSSASVDCCERSRANER